MRRLLLALTLLLGLPVVAAAQQTSVIYMPLTQSAQFLERVTYNIVLAAPAIELEAQAYTAAPGDSHPVTNACHSLRAAMAAQIMHGGSGNFAPFFALALVTNSAVTTAGSLTGSLGAGTLDSPATDAALFSAINAVWSTVAGCVTNP